jgi:hypothetical protein
MRCCVLMPPVAADGQCQGPPLVSSERLPERRVLYQLAAIQHAWGHPGPAQRSRDSHLHATYAVRNCLELGILSYKPFFCTRVVRSGSLLQTLVPTLRFQMYVFQLTALIVFAACTQTVIDVEPI